MRRSFPLAWFAVVLVAACSSNGGSSDAGSADSGGPADARQVDASPPDAPSPPDAYVPAPNLVLVPDSITPTIFQDEQNFSMNSCSIEEMCVGGSGLRKLLRFATVTMNAGDANLEVGTPGGSDLWVYSSCHGHYHFQDYALYELVGPMGIVAVGRKQAFCLEDTDQIDPAADLPNDNPPAGPYNCFYQGIHAGWADTYSVNLTCQWIDITDVVPGDYTLRISINPAHILPESSYDDNVFETPVTITAM